MSSTLIIIPSKHQCWATGGKAEGTEVWVAIDLGRTYTVGMVRVYRRSKSLQSRLKGRPELICILS